MDGFPVRQDLAEDTMVMAQLNQSNLPIGLKPTAKRIVDRGANAGEKMLKESMTKQHWDWATVPTDFGAYWQYGALDPVLTCRIAEKLEPKIFPQFRRSYEIEMAAIHVLRDAQIAGMQVDVEYATRLSAELGEEMEALFPTLPCNPGSDKKVVEFLQGRGALLTKKTEKGNYSVDDDVLKFWEANGIPECGPMRRYRKCQKLKTSYFDNLLRSSRDGIIHPSIRVLGAQKTGRMSVTSPALQTLPRSATGRNAFVARDGCTLLMPDFAGIEMRLMAHCADERQLKQLYAEGVDVHGWTAQKVYGLGDEAPAKKQRQIAKGAGFGKVFGAGIDTFSNQAGITTEAAEDFMEMYDGLFPGIKAFQNQVIAEVEAGNGRRWGKVHTEFGRQLYVEKDLAYKGVNYRIQGTAGEVLKVKLAELDAAGLGQFIRLPIHDEIVFEVPDGEVADVTRVIEEVMPERDLFSVPLEIEIKGAKRWGHAYLDDGEQPYLAPGEECVVFGE
jgi:DNA polymerase-1